MKKILAIALTLCMVLALCSCGQKDTAQDQDPNANNDTEVKTEAFAPDPEKTITLIVPQGAGGGTDTQARQLVEAMKEVSGFQNIIVENVTGGSTGIGTNQVIDSEADGYTLLMYGTYVVCGTMTGYTDGYKGLDFIAGLSLEPFMLAVKADSPYNTLDDVIKAAKANQGSITLGNAGATATTGVVAYGMNIACDNAFNVVAFNGSSELIPAVLGGHCDIGVFSQSEVLANADGLKPLVFLGQGHSVLDEFKDVPTLAEAGYGDLNVPGGCFRGICCTKGAPAEMEQWLADTVEAAFNSDKFQSFLNDNGLLAQFSKLGDFEKFNADMIETMKPIIQATGLAAGEYAA